MTADFDPEDPRARVQMADRDRYLAVLHAPVAAQAGLFALFALDLELAEVVATTSEPLLGEIRLAWWREQLARLDWAPAPAQPTLAALAQHVVPGGVNGASLEALEDAHLTLLLDADFENGGIDGGLFGYLSNRGGTLFAAAATLLGADAFQGRDLGCCWALGDFVRRGNHPPLLSHTSLQIVRHRVTMPAPEASRSQRIRTNGRLREVTAFNRALRPLAALAQLGLADVDAVLAGRTLGPRGTAGRHLSFLRMSLTGR